MSEIKTQTENPKGLHQRYFIQKIVKNPDFLNKITHTFMGEDATPEFTLKPCDENAEYFVLRLDKNGGDPKHIEACRKAVIAYAVNIEPHLPELAKDLIDRYGQIKRNKMSQKLDNFNKILLATGTINYMASALEGVRKDYQTIVAINSKKENPDEFSEGLASKNEMMDETLKKLCAVIEDLGNYLDGHDIVCPIDARIYSVPLNILLHDMDEEETVYENEEVV